MDTSDLKKLKAHWRSLIDRSRYRGNVSQLSLDIGKSESYLRGALSDKSVPKVDVSIALARQLGYSLDQLMDVGSVPPIDPKAIGDAISAQISQIMSDRAWGANRQPTGEDVMKWWLSTNGRLENCDFISDKFDLFEVPDGSAVHLKPYSLGARSLSTQSLGTTSLDVFDRTVAPLDERYRRLILKAQRSSIDTGPVTTIETLDAVHPDDGRDIKIEYTRTFAPVQIEGGKQLVLNYSKLIRETGEVSGAVRKVDAA